jgi:hypothetical protein
MRTEVDPDTGVEYVVLPVEFGLTETGGKWTPPPPTLWQRVVSFLKRRRS